MSIEWVEYIFAVIFLYKPSFSEFSILLSFFSPFLSIEDLINLASIKISPALFPL